MSVDWDEIRADIIGNDATIATPYGGRRVVYADFTASGRALRSFERYVEYLLEHYANTHTEDDTTGRLTSRRLSAAEKTIKDRLNADEHYKLIAVGAGATAAINRLQQILGVYIPPATRDRLECIGCLDAADPALRSRLPVVFVGPYEHHSNEISWREGLAEVVEVELDEMGRLSLDDLEAKLVDTRWDGRQKIGSFSAASNVSGVRTDVYAVARLLHRHGALAFFDYSASAPYVGIDVRRDEEAYFDGVFFSPHKYLGGPGASGVLLVRDTLYRDDLPPSVSGGGTVSFVNATIQDYIEDIEEREKAGTPGIMQTIRAALAIDLQHLIGIDAIEAREQDLIGRALDRLGAVSGIEIVGDAPPHERLAIFSFNIRSGGGYLHPRFVVRLLNDLFGVQSRAGCSCAGPYGHRLLRIDRVASERYRTYVRRGEHGVKPGWVRLNFHYLATDEEFDFLCSAVEFIARHGRLFLADYRFDLKSGAWVHRDETEGGEVIDATAALERARPGRLPNSTEAHPQATDGDAIRAERARYFAEASSRADELSKRFCDEDLEKTADELIPLRYLSSGR